jgi:hypothetical protein
MGLDQHEDLQRRIERLERGYHKWRRTGLAAIGIAVALLAYSAYSYAQRPEGGPRPAAEPPKADAQPIAIDAAGMRTTYTNFFRATGNPDEVILDFGMYSQVITPTGAEPIKLTDRMVMNFYTAKKLQAVLQTVVTRHEDAYGEIQLDPQKRVRPKRGDE